MEGIVKIAFNCPDQEKEMRMALDGSKWYMAWVHLQNDIRTHRKNNDNESGISYEMLFKMMSDAQDLYNLPYEY
ncbi:MAG: hypothetical protein U0Y10_09265 [Spirosomataceae bacterium]